MIPELAQDGQAHEVSVELDSPREIAMGGEESGRENAANAMKLVADDVQTVVLSGAGHWVAEQAPKELLSALTSFLAPYRDASHDLQHTRAMTH